jgi:hypothetical protein
MSGLLIALPDTHRSLAERLTEDVWYPLQSPASSLRFVHRGLRYARTAQRHVPVALSPKAPQLLRLLVEQRPRALSKTELYEALWPTSFVVDANLVNLISVHSLEGNRSCDAAEYCCSGGSTCRMS